LSIHDGGLFIVMQSEHMKVRYFIPN